ncbi:MAG TPA: hypothetical protein VMC07_01665 [Candidatus Omnitrophota bacterium]|nr:hypothetical protein [Candidatus Omnitrophota bacterium]
MTVNKDIVAGIKSALSRGYSIDEAMLSFLNAGYKREEVEEAAHSLQGLVLSQASPELKPEIIWPGEKETPSPKPDLSPKKTVPEAKPQAPVVKSTVAEAPLPNVKPISRPEVKERIVPIAVPVQTSASINRVSAYNSYSKRIKTITTILVALLILLLGILGLMYAFRSQIISFFNSLFSGA